VDQDVFQAGHRWPEAAAAVEGVELAGEVRPGFDVVDNIYC